MNFYLTKASGMQATRRQHEILILGSAGGRPDFLISFHAWYFNASSQRSGSWPSIYPPWSFAKPRPSAKRCSQMLKSCKVAFGSCTWGLLFPLRLSLQNCFRNQQGWQEHFRGRDLESPHFRLATYILCLVLYANLKIRWTAYIWLKSLSDFKDSRMISKLVLDFQYIALAYIVFLTISLSRHIHKYII